MNFCAICKVPTTQVDALTKPRMHCLPVVNVGRPDTVQLSGSTTLKALKAVCNWIVSGFDTCPKNTESIRSPIFCHADLSKWCVELEMRDGCPKICFRLVASSDFQPVDATVKATIVDRKGVKQCVYPPAFFSLDINETSRLLCMTEVIDTKELGKDWNFECEVCTVQVIHEDTSDADEDDVQAAVAKDLECLLNSKDLTDITLIAGGVRLDAHRAILCARSPVFKAMLSYDTKEAGEGLVEIPDVEPEVLTELLRYMYTDRVQVPGDMTELLLAAFDKYGIQDAKLKCELDLAKQLTVDSVADIVVFAISHSCSFLQKVCVAFIKHNLLQVVGTRGWVNIIDKCPEAVKTVCELIVKGPQRCSSPPAPPATSDSQSESTITEKSTTSVEPVPEHNTPAACAGSCDAVWDPAYTRCERKKVVYVWTISGLTDWPHDETNITSPRFYHPDTVQWEVRLYKYDINYYVRLKMVENKFVGSVLVDLSVSIILPEGEKRNIITSTENVFEEPESESNKFQCGCLVDDSLTLECEISMICVIEQCLGAVVPELQSGLVQDLHSLLESGNFADFKLCAGTVEMGVHRAILVARSPFFARKLQSGLEVLNKGQMEVPDMKSEVLAEILQYMYTGRVKNLSDSTGELMAAAHRFEMWNLKKECGKHLSRQLTVSNAVTTAVTAMENQCDTLLDFTVEFIQSHFKQVLGTAEWLEAIDKQPAVVKRISQLIADAGK